MISSTTRDAYKIAKIWSFACIFLFLIFILTQKSSYMEIDAFGMWVLSCAAILYLSRKDTGTLAPGTQRLLLITGLLMCVLSFVSIPLGITNPPYTIGELSLLVSGIGVIVFSRLGYRSLLLPVSIPFIAVMGYGAYEVFLRNEDWITAPLIPFITQTTTTILYLLGINSVTTGNVISFMSQAGSPIYLSVVSDCTGIWSLGTFTVAVIIVVSSFPAGITKMNIVWIAIGYLGTFLANIIRIIAIILSGYYYGPSGVMEQVHIHIGWIVFSLWMVIFWYFYFTRHLKISIFKKGDSLDSKNSEK